jgi:hypothetical protein
LYLKRDRREGKKERYITPEENTKHRLQGKSKPRKR